MILSNFYVLVQFLENFVTYNLVGDANHDNSIACAPYVCVLFYLFKWTETNGGNYNKQHCN